VRPIRQQLTCLVGDAFEAIGIDRNYGQVVPSQRPDLGDYQCNGAIAASGLYHRAPRAIAFDLAQAVARSELIGSLEIAGPGFINVKVSNDFLAGFVDQMASDPLLGCEPVTNSRVVIVDYGGPNVAKPMHVGHLRAAIIGESLKRIFRFRGDQVMGDIHLGDWGTQMGMLIMELARRRTELPYFDPGFTGRYPAASPVTIEDLAEMYPAANRRCEADPAEMDAARQATLDLQRGRPGYRALWNHFVAVSVAEIRREYAQLNVEFDLWLGESGVNDRIPALLRLLTVQGFAHESQGALVVDVSMPDDDKPVPPLMLVKSDGAILYGTTDLATIEQRVEELQAQLILYIVDHRQSDHFLQVFRSASKTKGAPPSVELEHIGFGTVNGMDGRPLKTKAGGVMRLRDLIDLTIVKAREHQSEQELQVSPEEREEIARRVGVAAIKFADLDNHYSSDYRLDLDRFTAFEGRTGPYLLNAIVRPKAILGKASEASLRPGSVVPPQFAKERALMFQLCNFTEAVQQAYDKRAPNYVAGYAYDLAKAFHAFFETHHVLHEQDRLRQGSWLAMCDLSVRVLETCLFLLGIQSLDRM
jgi:arginyl-tRNA synthetase